VRGVARSPANDEVMSLFDFFHPRKIRSKLFGSVSLLIAVITAFILFFFPRQIRRQAFEAMAVRAESVAGATAVSLSPALSARDLKTVQDALQEAEENTDLVYVVVTNPAGEVVAAKNPAAAEKAGFKELDAGYSILESGRIFAIRAPVSYKNSPIGHLHLGLSTAGLKAEIRRYQLAIVLISVLIFSCGLVIAYGIGALITRPLSQMTRTVEWIAKGNIKQRTRVTTRDEVGQLGKSINRMVDSLQSAYRQTEELNRTLEQKAGERGKDLEREIEQRRRMEKELRVMQDELEQRVSRRTYELAGTEEKLRSKVYEVRRAEDQLQNMLDKLRKALEGTVRAMSLTIEMRDLYTAGHQRRVMDLAVAIAMEMCLPEEKIEGIRVAGVIHDIGKIAMPAEILAKPTKLTRTEFQLIKDHPKVGYDILKSIEFPWPVAHIVLQHHERMDGSGYPEGLSGDAILIEARILAVADVVEATSSHRPYRPAQGLQKALDEIQKNRGVLYDRNVVDACLKLFKQRRYKFEIDSTQIM